MAFPMAGGVLKSMCHVSHPRIIRRHHGCPAALRHHSSGNRLLLGVQESAVASLDQCHLLSVLARLSDRLPLAGLLMEVVSRAMALCLDKDLTDVHYSLSVTEGHTFRNHTILCRRSKSSTCRITDRDKNSKFITRAISTCLEPVGFRFQKAIKKVRATQRMRRQRGFAFSQTESKTQDQEKLIRAYDTSIQRPSGY